MIAYNRFSQARAGSTAIGKPSYEIDLPNAGTSYVIGNVIQQPASNSNPTMLAYGEEGASNPGKNLYVVNNTFLNDDTAHGTFVLIGSGVTRRPCCRTISLAVRYPDHPDQCGAEDQLPFGRAGLRQPRQPTTLHPTANALVIECRLGAGGVGHGHLAQAGRCLQACGFRHCPSGAGHDRHRRLRVAVSTS